MFWTGQLPSRFYAIADSSAGHAPVELAHTLLSAGAKVLQLRLKDARTRDFLKAARAIATLARAAGATFIVNDRVDIAILAEADGVHLGQEDLPIEAARRLIGAGKVIGISTHCVAQAKQAEAGGADYIGFGPIFEGGLKRTRAGQGLDKLRAVRAAVRVPIVAIGGITEESIDDVLRAGADAAAIISAVLRTPDIAAKVRRLVSPARHDLPG